MTDSNCASATAWDVFLDGDLVCRVEDEALARRFSARSAYLVEPSEKAHVVDHRGGA
ncbi:hypothetical protein [Haloarchaeobius sp. DFWS5]|uniref:hypothetical protein n=1 Tax=Haloarchaeobius sp. DFWS5 TaxID=3446114 RepID=UPI003EBE6661